MWKWTPGWGVGKELCPHLLLPSPEPQLSISHPSYSYFPAASETWCLPFECPRPLPPLTTPAEVSPAAIGLPWAALLPSHPSGHRPATPCLRHRRRSSAQRRPPGGLPAIRHGWRGRGGHRSLHRAVDLRPRRGGARPEDPRKRGQKRTWVAVNKGLVWGPEIATVFATRTAPLATSLEGGAQPPFFFGLAVFFLLVWGGFF